ncbi:MAG: sulfotransferase [Actinobacteria bacterium]|uniref:Sulfotransferase n=1 Tax=Nostocoides veronense TaxID=330836 RepID=A0ABP4Y1U3_9MICO|nr:sulfotransferase [Actinomycetota bacterium]
MTASLPPAFILGTGRCGSTLVHELIARHPATGFVTNLDDLGVRQGNAQQLTLWRRLPAAVSEKGRARLAPSEGYRVLAREVSPAIVDPVQDPTAADLTPWLEQRLHAFVEKRMSGLDSAEIFLHKFTGWPRASLIAAAFPDARFVHIVRDGRAVANSWLQMDWWKGHLGPAGWHFGPLPPELDAAWAATGRSQPALAAIAWRMLVDRHEECAAELGDRWLTVRYEDVLADSRTHLERILVHIGLSWTDAFESGIARYTLSPSRKAAYLKDLTPEQVATMESLIGDQLARYDYA